jgi:beta-lactamase class A
MQNVNELIGSLGLRTMKLQRKMLDRDSQARGQDNISSPADAATLMTRIARCDLPISKASCERARQILEIPQPDHPGKDPIPSDIPIAFKWGGNTGVSTAWAIVDLPGRPYVFAIMTSFGTDNAPAVRAASAAAFGYFSRLAGANPYGGRVTPPRNPRPGQGG